MKRYFIKTFGCQQNESDSERITAFLEKQGYKKAEKLEEADLIVVNACSVRQTAIDRVLGLKKKFEHLKAKKILTGCVLKSDRIKFRKFFDDIVDIRKFLGRDCLSALAFVPIMTGCDNFCSYCVVPYTRGREISRPVKEIINEVKNLIKNGCKEITLLGQNVNSYQHGFAALLRKINSIPGDFQIKFLTSHPKDVSDDLIDAIAKCGKVVKEIHLPIQSGDNEILRKMNRHYTAGQYKKLIEKIRKKIPGVKISTDVIVGFPSETKKQFQNTVKVFKEIKFDKAYINKYSARAGTAAARFKDDVLLEEKKRRWKILDEIVNKQDRHKLIVILGPTASGKSDLAVKLAKKFFAPFGGGEIISADSRQVYKGMDIGTGKITKKEMRGVPHYCLDIASPKTQFTVAQYREIALRAIDKIYKRNKIPILCGGTGFYIQAVAEGLIIPRVKPDWKLREELEKEDTEELFKELKKLDPRRAKNIDAKNRRRLIRALEIIKKTGKPVPILEKKSQFDVLYLGTKKSPKELKELIKRRLLHRLKQGMIAEVRKLRKSGLSQKRLNDFGLEYRYIARYLQGQLSKKEMVERLQKEIEHYAKRQMTWFKRDKSIHWIRNYKEAKQLAGRFLRR